jgi:polysaccharide export outer membrane protein
MKHDALSQTNISSQRQLSGRCAAICRCAALLISVVLIAGCRGPNHFFAESMPSSLLVGSRSNPQEADLSRLASATGGSQIIGPGDILEVNIAAGLTEDDQIKLPVRVNDAGEASLPDIGTVQLAGFEPQAAESLIRMEAIRQRLYQNPTVTVTVTHQRMNRVRVLGAVVRPGVYELPPNSSDIVSAIAAAEGLAEDAGENVEIRNPIQPGSRPRAIAGMDSDPITGVSSSSDGVTTAAGGMNSYTVNLISAAKSSSENYIVQDGGVVMVEKSDPAPVQVLGLVRAPGRYEFPIGQDLYLLDALALAGGVSNQLANKIFVIRPLANSSDPAVIEVSMRTAKRSGESNIRLAPGDVVSVEQTPATVLMEALQIIRFSVTGNAFSGI